VFHESKPDLLAGQRFADGMGLGMREVELDGRRDRSLRLASDGTGKQQNQNGSAMPAGTRALQWGNSPVEG
jgi:hypothetical protein